METLLRLVEKNLEVKALVINPTAMGLPGGYTDLGSVVRDILPVVISATGLLMFGYLILGGIKYITAAGDSKQIQDAVKTITNAVVGLAIVFTAFWIVRILETVFGISITH